MKPKGKMWCCTIRIYCTWNKASNDLLRLTSISSLAPPSDLAGDFLPPEPPDPGVRAPPASGVCLPDPPPEPVEFRSFLLGDDCDPRPGDSFVLFGATFAGGGVLTSGLTSSVDALVDLPRSPRFLTGMDFSAEITKNYLQVSNFLSNNVCDYELKTTVEENMGTNGKKVKNVNTLISFKL